MTSYAFVCVIYLLHMHCRSRHLCGPAGPRVRVTHHGGSFSGRCKLRRRRACHRAGRGWRPLPAEDISPSGRSCLMPVKQSELGKVLNKGSKEYDRLLIEVDAELLARSSRRPQAGSDDRRRSTRHRNPSSMGLMSAGAAYQGEQQNPKRQKSRRS